MSPMMSVSFGIAKRILGIGVLLTLSGLLTFTVLRV